jgi:fatty-acyl-CoA synthase
MKPNFYASNAVAAPSYVHGSSDRALIGDTIGVHFDRITERHAERPALVVRQQAVRWTWGALRRRVDNLAVSLRRLGLAPGERIGIGSPNRAEWVLTQFATAKAGLVLVNINPAYRRDELRYALDQKFLLRRQMAADLGLLREAAGGQEVTA